MRKGYIYCITDRKNGLKYVGQHRATDFDPTYFGSGRIIKDMAKKYSLEDRFDREVLVWCESESQLDEMEQYWISLLGTLHPRGYNLTSGGEQEKCYSRETIEKIRLATSGSRHRLYGKHHSPEVIEKIRISNIGKKKIRSPEGEKRYWAGRVRQIAATKTPEYRQAMRQRNSGVGNPRYIAINKDEFLEARGQMTIKELMNHFGISKGTIYNKLIEFGLSCNG